MKIMHQLLKRTGRVKRHWGVMFIGLATLGLQSCNKHFSAGPIVTEDRVLTDSVTAIHVNGSFDVIITQDTSYDVRIEAGERLMRYIETDLDNNVLTLRERRNHYVVDKTVRVYVSAYYVEEIELNGSGDIYADHLSASGAFVLLAGSGDINLHYDTLTTATVDLKGSGDIRLTGTATTCNIELDGSGDISCEDLIAQDAYVHLDGSGNINVYASSSLTVNVDGSGNVYYWGNPPIVNTTVNGSGNVKPM